MKAQPASTYDIEGLGEGVFVPTLSDAPCPCGQTFSIGVMQVPAQPDATVVVHRTPACEQYLQLDPVAYVRWVRRRSLLR